MRHFRESEFNAYDKMDKTFLEFLDQVRHLANVPFYLTSDYRTPEHNRAVGGHETSLHTQGCAVDFTTPASRDRDSQAFYSELFDIVWAVYDVHDRGGGGWRKVQLELVKSDRDWHLHLGLFKEGWAGDSKLIVSTD